MLQTNTDQANIETKVRAVSSPVVANRNSTRVPWRCICTDAVLLPQSSDSAEIREAKEKEKQKTTAGWRGIACQKYSNQRHQMSWNRRDILARRNEIQPFNIFAFLAYLMAPCMYKSHVITSVPLQWQLRIFVIVLQSQCPILFCFWFIKPLCPPSFCLSLARPLEPCFLWRHQTSEIEKEKGWVLCAHLPLCTGGGGLLCLVIRTSLLFVWRCACLLCYFVHCNSFFFLLFLCDDACDLVLGDSSWAPQKPVSVASLRLFLFLCSTLSFFCLPFTSSFSTGGNSLSKPATLVCIWRRGVANHNKTLARFLCFRHRRRCMTR